MSKILIVDDASFVRMSLKKLLLSQGYTVVEANNGVTAVQQYTATKPDLVIMAITMPEMNGIDAVKAIKNLDNNAKIIMCSAMGQHKKVVASIRAGALDFIVKPYEEEHILNSIKKALAI